MNLRCALSVFPQVVLLAALAGLAAPVLAADASAPVPSNCQEKASGSPYIPVDSWIYPATLRLYSLGYADPAFLGLRPWTRQSLGHVLDYTEDQLKQESASAAHDEAQPIYLRLRRELSQGGQDACGVQDDAPRIESSYTNFRAVSGTPLRDSYHLGQTFVNDFGRPYENGLQNYTGVSGYAARNRFAFYARGEFQGASSGDGYSYALAQQLSTLDWVTYPNPNTGSPYNQSTIPLGPISSTVNGRVMEAYLAADVLGHVVSFGKQDAWLGPGQGGSMAFSNNAENFYSFRINRAEPLRVPLLSRLTGPFRYDFFVGSLKGHIYPNDPWMHVEKISFKPTRDLEFGWERSVIWGGKGHEPITIKTFLRSFFSLTNVNGATKLSNRDPGARFGAFDATWRLPGLRNWATLYVDSEAHDDVSPVDAPRRASYRPGLYLSHLPALPKLDLRMEGVSTDPPTSRSNAGEFNYFEAVQRQGYTNKGFIMGDWIGREAKGGQLWTTWHLGPDEWIQASFRHQKNAKDFIAGGTTLNDYQLQVVKRLGKDLELNGSFLLEQYKAPIYKTGQQTVTGTTVQLTWFPHRKIELTK